jgi:hypothetical protein
VHRRLATRDFVCLALGLIVGAGLVLCLPLSSILPGWRGQRTQPELHPAAAAVAVGSHAAPSPARTPIDLAAIIAELRSPGETRPRSLLLLGKLDKETLRRLALVIPDWPPSRQRDLTLRDVYKRWGEIEPRAALTQAQQVKMPLGLGAIHAAVRGFVESDPARACAMLAAPPAADQGAILRVKTFRDGQLAEALLNWSEQDPQAAIEFLLQLPPGDLGPRTVTDVTTAWARQDPVVALGWASQLANPLLRADATRGAVSAWTETEPAAAASYVSSLPPGFQRDMLTETVVHDWVQQDPSAAASWASAQTGVTQGRALEAVASGWADNDAPAAAAWVVQLPAGRVRDTAWEAVATAWSLNDSAAAVVWLGELPPGTGRDAAIVGYSEGRGSVDPPQTLTWVQQIGNPVLRDETTARILQAWLVQNPDAAQQWISQTPLSRAVRAQLGIP